MWTSTQIIGECFKGYFIICFICTSDCVPCFFHFGFTEAADPFDFECRFYDRILVAEKQSKLLVYSQKLNFIVVGLKNTCSADVAVEDKGIHGIRIPEGVVVKVFNGFKGQHPVFPG